MSVLRRYGGLGRVKACRSRHPEPSLREILLGVSAFLVAVAACLYAVARIGS